jgi:hypothetical protein
VEGFGEGERDMALMLLKGNQVAVPKGSILSKRNVVNILRSLCQDFQSGTLGNLGVDLGVYQFIE